MYSLVRNSIAWLHGGSIYIQVPVDDTVELVSGPSSWLYMAALDCKTCQAINFTKVTRVIFLSL